MDGAARPARTDGIAYLFTKKHLLAADVLQKGVKRLEVGQCLELVIEPCGHSSVPFLKGDLVDGDLGHGRVAWWQGWRRVEACLAGGWACSFFRCGRRAAGRI